MGTVPVGRKKRTDVAGGPQTFRSPTAVVVWWVWLLFAAANLIDLAVQGRDHLSLVAAAILLLATGVAYVAAQRPRIVADSSGLTVVNPLRDYHIGWAGVTKVDLADLLRVHCQVQGGGKIIYAWAVHYSRRRKLAADAKTRRQAARANSGRSTFGTFGLSGGYGSGSGVGRRELGYASRPAADPASSAEADAERISRILNEYATAARAETVWAEGTVEIAGASPSAQPAPEPGSEPRPDPGSEPGPKPAGAIDTAGDAAADPRMAGWREPLTSTWDRTALLALLIPALILLIVALV
jgi:Bacterial PH domain